VSQITADLCQDYMLWRGTLNLSLVVVRS